MASANHASTRPVRWNAVLQSVGVHRTCANPRHTNVPRMSLLQRREHTLSMPEQIWKQRAANGRDLRGLRGKLGCSRASTRRSPSPTRKSLRRQRVLVSPPLRNSRDDRRGTHRNAGLGIILEFVMREEHFDQEKHEEALELLESQWPDYSAEEHQGLCTFPE